MRFAVFSDPRGNLEATRAVFQNIDDLESGVDSVICLGNVVGHGPHPNEVVQILVEREVQSIRGNYDEFIAGMRSNTGIDYPSRDAVEADRAALDWTRRTLTEESLAYVKKMPGDARVSVSRSGRATDKLKESEPAEKRERRGLLMQMMVGSAVASLGETPARFRPKGLLFVHGSPRDVVENLYPHTARSILDTIARRANSDVVVHGRTARPYQRLIGSTAFVGVGRAGWPDAPGIATYAVVECLNFELNIEFREVAFDSQSEAREAELQRLPELVVDTLRNGAP
jgi:predicted phosphodiesterase